MEHLIHRTKILLGAVYSLIDMHAIDEVAEAFEEYCDALAWTLEDFTDEAFTRAELIQYSFEHVLAEIKINHAPLTEQDAKVIGEMEKLWQERLEGEKENRDKLYDTLMGDDDDG